MPLLDDIGKGLEAANNIAKGVGNFLAEAGKVSDDLQNVAGDFASKLKKLRLVGAKKLMVDDIVIDLIDDEEIDFSQDPQDHPVQTGVEVTDHSWLKPYVIPVVGKIVSEPPKGKAHHRKFEKLKRLVDERREVTITIDFPPQSYEPFRITDLRFKRQRSDALPSIDANYYLVSFTARQTQYAFTTAGALPVTDPLSRAKLEGSDTDLGEQEPIASGGGNNWFDSVVSFGEGAMKALSGEKPGDGGLLDFIAGGVQMFEDATGMDVSDALYEGAKALANSVIPGSGAAIDLAAAALSGDLSAGKIAQIAMDNIPGMGAVKDMINTVSDVASSIPGGASALGALASGDVNGAVGALASGVVGAVGEAVPALAPAAGLAQQWMSGPQGKQAVAGAVSATASSLGVPPGLLAAAGG